MRYVTSLRCWLRCHPSLLPGSCRSVNILVYYHFNRSELLSGAEARFVIASKAVYRSYHLITARKRNESKPRKMTQVPALAALHHNDCLHVANTLVTLPHALQPDLGRLLNERPPDFGADSERLRAAGERCLHAQVLYCPLPPFLHPRNGF